MLTPCRWGTADYAGQQLVTPKIPLTPSFEDLASVANSAASITNDSSGSNDSFEEGSTNLTPDQLSLSSHESPSPEMWKRKQLSAQGRRDMFHISRSSADVTFHKKESSSAYLDINQGRSSSAQDRTGDLRHKRQVLMKIHKASESDPTFASHLLTKEKGRLRTRGISSTALSESRTERGSEGGRELRPRHINKATGLEIRMVHCL